MADFIASEMPQSAFAQLTQRCAVGHVAARCRRSKNSIAQFASGSEWRWLAEGSAKAGVCGLAELDD